MIKLMLYLYSIITDRWLLYGVDVAMSYWKIFAWRLFSCGAFSGKAWKM